MDCVINTVRPLSNAVTAKPECGSPKRKGGICQSKHLYPNGRCRLHGGKALSGAASPLFKDGKHSKTFYLPPVLNARVEQMGLDLVENLEESIKIQASLETQLHEKLGTGESTEAWIKLKSAVSDYDSAEYGDPKEKALEQAQAFGIIRFLVNEGLSETFLRRDIQSIHESQRKLSESVSKIRKEMQETYTQEQWNVMLNVVFNIIKEEIDGRAVGRIVTRINALTSEGKREPKLLSGASSAV